MVPLAHPSLLPKSHVDPFSHFSAVHQRHCLYFIMGRDIPPKLPFPWEDPSPHIIHGSVGSPKSTIQMAYRFVHPFLQVRCQRHTPISVGPGADPGVQAVSPQHFTWCQLTRLTSYFTKLYSSWALPLIHNPSATARFQVYTDSANVKSAWILK